MDAFVLSIWRTFDHNIEGRLLPELGQSFEEIGDGIRDDAEYTDTRDGFSVSSELQHENDGSNPVGSLVENVRKVLSRPFQASFLYAGPSPQGANFSKRTVVKEILFGRRTVEVTWK